LIGEEMFKFTFRLLPHDIYDFLQRKVSSIEHGTKEIGRGESVIVLFHLLTRWTPTF
jgi:hypothetical protein